MAQRIADDAVEHNAERIAKMAQRIADDAVDKPLIQVDQSIDLIIAGVQGLAEWLPRVETLNDKQKAAKEKAIDLVETALAPYAADAAKAIEELGAEEHS